MASERLVVEVSEKGALVVKRNIADIGKGAQKAGGGVQLLRRALGLLASAAIIRGLVNLADTFTNIQNRLRTVTDTQEELAAVTKELFAISNRTRSSFEATAEVYARVGLAAKDLGLSQKQLLEFTESLNQAVILSGASATEAQAGLLQLSQGLASGTLRGDELRSVLEQLPVVADVIAKSMNITRGELRKMGEDGKITADIVLSAFAGAREELDERFGEAVPTVSQAFTILRNNVTKMVGDLDASSGATRSLAKAIIDVAGNLDALIPPIQFVGDVLRATLEESAALINPLLVQLTEWGVTNESLKATMVDLGIAMVALLRTAAQVVDKILGLFTGLVGAIIFFIKGLPDAASEVFQDMFLKLVGDVEDGLNAIIRTINKARALVGQGPLEELDFSKVFQKDPELEGAARELGTTVKDVFLEGFNQTGLTDLVDNVVSRVEDLQLGRTAAGAEPEPTVDLSQSRERTAVKNLEAEAFAKVVAGLEKENELLALNSTEREIQAELFKIEKQLKKDLQGEQEQVIIGLLQSNQALSEQAQLLQDIKGPQELYNRQVEALDILLQQGKITIDEYNRKLKELKSNVDEALGGGAAEDVLSSIFNNGIDALSDFNSKWRDFIGQVFQDIARLISQQLILQAIKSASGPLGFLGFQHGGSFTVGGQGGSDSQLVAFNATPGERVDVSTPQQQQAQNQGAQAQQAPTVNIINVTDPKEITEVMSTQEGQQVIINTVQRNPTLFRQALS